MAQQHPDPEQRHDNGANPGAGRVEHSALLRHRLLEGRASPLATYRDITVGLDRGIGYFILFEVLTSLLGPMPGGAGFWLRKKLYPLLFRRIGRGFIIGRNVTIRHPSRIEIGDNVTIDDNCLVDGRGEGETGVRLGDGVVLNRNCMVVAKNGAIRIGARSSIGANSVIVSLSGIELGEAVLTAGNCGLSAGAYRVDDVDPVIMDQEPYTNGPIRVGDGAWLGTGAVLLDGVSVGRGAVIGAGAIVREDVPELCIAAGIPARVLRKRRMSGDEPGRVDSANTPSS